jgi:hypothetical protein
MNQIARCAPVRSGSSGRRKTAAEKLKRRHHRLRLRLRSEEACHAPPLVQVLSNFRPALVRLHTRTETATSRFDASSISLLRSARDPGNSEQNKDGTEDSEHNAQPKHRWVIGFSPCEGPVGGAGVKEGQHD